MPREVTVQNGTISFTERVEDADGDSISVDFVELDSVIDDTGTVTEKTGSARTPSWLSFSESFAENPPETSEGTSRLSVNLSLSVSSLQAGYSYVLQLKASDSFGGEATRKVTVRYIKTATSGAIITQKSLGFANGDGVTSLSVDTSDSQAGEYMILPIGLSDSGVTVTPPSFLSELTSRTHSNAAGLTLRVYGGVVPSGGRSNISLNFSSSVAATTRGFSFGGVDTANPVTSTATSEAGSILGAHDISTPGDLSLQPNVGGNVAFSVVAANEANSLKSDALIQSSGLRFAFTSGGVSIAGAMRRSVPGATGIDPLNIKSDSTVSHDQVGGTVALKPDPNVTPNPPDAQWQKSLHQQLSTGSVGYAYAVASQGQITESNGYGWYRHTDESSNPAVPFTATKPHLLNDFSKIITGVAILRLAENGAFDLSDTAASLTPNTFDPANMGAGVDQITVRDLLQMRGATNNQNIPYNINNSNSFSSKKAAIEDWLSADRTSEREVEYQNPQFAWLQYVIEEVTGEDYVTWVQNNIFSNVTSSFQPSSPSGHSPVVYETQETGSATALSGTPTPSSWTGVGGWYGTAEDMALFLSEIRQGAVISEGSFAKMRDQKLACFQERGSFGAYSGQLTFSPPFTKRAEIGALWFGEEQTLAFVTNTSLLNKVDQRDDPLHVARRARDVPEPDGTPFFVVSNSEGQNNGVQVITGAGIETGRLFWLPSGDVRSIGRDGSTFYVPHREEGVIYEVDRYGDIEGTVGAPASELQGIVAARVDSSAGKLYVSSRQGFIKRMNLDGSNLETLRSSADTPQGAIARIEIDVESGRIFSPELTQIAVLQLDGTVLQTISLPYSGNAQLTSLDYSPSQNRIYYGGIGTDFDGKLREVRPDGTNEAVVTSGFTNIREVHIDEDAGEIYIGSSTEINRIGFSETSASIVTNFVSSSLRSIRVL